eukprot:scaffold1054_cov124-Cylindrotheca_fusiformis.AAC.13
MSSAAAPPHAQSPLEGTLLLCLSNAWTRSLHGPQLTAGAMAVDYSAGRLIRPSLWSNVDGHCAKLRKVS